jgi:hypothetical protein
MSRKSARLSLKSSEVAPPARESCPPSPLLPGGEAHSLAGEGAEGAKSDEGTDTLVLQGIVH